MTDDDSSHTGKPGVEFAPKSRNLRSVLLLACGITAALAILYGITASNGKKEGSEVASACPISTLAAGKVGPLAIDKMAALAVSKTPKTAVNISFNGPAGKQLALEEFHGKTILLNLWATWCVPCRAEMPELDELQKDFGGETFEVVAVNIDTARLDRRQKFLEQIGVKHLKFYADKEAKSFQVLKQAGKVFGLPATFLIGPDGCEIGRMAGAAAWASDQAKKLIQTALDK